MVSYTFPGSIRIRQLTLLVFSLEDKGRFPGKLRHGSEWAFIPHLGGNDIRSCFQEGSQINRFVVPVFEVAPDRPH